MSIAVAALAVATFTGGDDNLDIRARRLAAQAEQYERDAHLAGQAKTYGRDRAGSDQHLVNLAREARQRAALETQAERYERDAHLAGQAKTYGGHSGSTDAIEDGNRAAQKAEAERYVEWLDDPAGSTSTDGDPSNDGFVPGSRHMPMR